MPSKRRRIERTPRSRITPAVVQAYKAGDWTALHAALRLKPWQESPLDVSGARPPYVSAESWQHAVELRHEIEEAMRCLANDAE